MSGLLTTAVVMKYRPVQNFTALPQPVNKEQADEGLKMMAEGLKIAGGYCY